MKPRILSREQHEWVAHQYQSGKTSTEIASKLEVSSVAVRDALRRMNVEIKDRRKREVNHAAFDVWTPEASYWAGFLFADGSIVHSPGRQPRVEIALSTVDRGHIVKLRDFLGSTHPIVDTEPTTNYGKFPRSELNIRSQAIAERLESAGMISPRQASDELAASPDFWRGVIDGDGSLTRNIGKPCVSLVGNYELLRQFSQFVDNFANYAPRIYRAGSIWKTALPFAYTLQVVNRLYGHVVNEGLPYLDRKYDTAWRWLKGNWEFYEPE